MKKIVIFPTVFTLLFIFNTGCTSFTRCTAPKAGQHPQSLEKTIRKTLKMDYLLYLPEQYATTRTKWPLILFLHGAGERGNDLEKVAKHGPPKLIASHTREFPFVIASPQCPQDDWWASPYQMEMLNTLLDDLVARYRIDTERIYVTGLSMGGFGTWRLARAYPHRFAAIAPICGGGDPECAQSIRHLPVWVFHGAKDETVSVKESEKMVDALKRVDGQVTFTVYPEAKHDSWTATYDNPELYTWFLKHTRSGNEQSASTQPPGTPSR